MTPMDQERALMLKTLGKIRDFYYGVNEGIKTPSSEAKTEDTAVKEQEDYV